MHCLPVASNPSVKSHLVDPSSACQNQHLNIFCQFLPPPGTRSLTHTCAHCLTHAHRCTHMHTFTHTHMHTFTHTHMYIHICSGISIPCCSEFQKLPTRETHHTISTVQWLRSVATYTTQCPGTLQGGKNGNLLCQIFSLYSNFASTMHGYIK